MRTKTVLVMAALAVPLVMGGCVLDDNDGVDYVPNPSSTTIIEKDNPDVHVTPAPNVTIERNSPPVIIDRKAPDVNIDVHNPPIEIKRDNGSAATTGY